MPTARATVSSVSGSGTQVHRRPHRGEVGRDVEGVGDRDEDDAHR